MNRLLGILFCLLSLASNGQPKFDLHETRTKYPYEDTYILSDRVDVRIAIVNNKLDVSAFTSTDMLFLNDKANMLSTRSISYYDESEEISDLKAFSYVPQENGKMKKIEVDKITTEKPQKQGIYYDDYKRINFSFNSLKSGAVGSYSYERRYKDVHFLDPYYFGSNCPAKFSECTVTFPKEVTLKYLIKGDTAGIKFSKTEAKNSVTYRWTMENLPSYYPIYEEGTFRRHNPHVIFFIDKYNTSTGEVAVLSDVRQLYKWYWSHVKDIINAPVPPIIQLLSDSLTRNITDENQKIKQIYYWVQNNIKYIAFEYGLGGFVPRNPDLVCERRYGDCKDKSSILFALLKAAGIKSHLTWIGTRDIPYTYNEVPTPIVDNHMIVALQSDHQWCFLDGTEKGLQWGYPSYAIQDKEALIAVSADSFQIVKVQPVDKDKNFRADSLVLSIRDGDLLGSGYTSFGGFWKRDIVVNLAYTSANKQQEEMSNEFNYGTNKCNTHSIEWNPPDYDQHLSFKYQFEIPEYVRQVDNKLIVNMHLKKYLSDAIIDLKERKTEVIYNYKYVNNQVSVLNIPGGYKIKEFPSNTKFEMEGFGFDINYSKSADRVIMKRSIYCNELVKTPDQFEKWNEMVEKLNDAYTSSLLLEKIN